MEGERGLSSGNEAPKTEITESVHKFRTHILQVLFFLFGFLLPPFFGGVYYCNIELFFCHKAQQCRKWQTVADSDGCTKTNIAIFLQSQQALTPKIDSAVCKEKKNKVLLAPAVVGCWPVKPCDTVYAVKGHIRVWKVYYYGKSDEKLWMQYAFLSNACRLFIGSFCRVSCGHGQMGFVLWRGNAFEGGGHPGTWATHIMLHAQRCKQPPAAAAAAKWQHKSEPRL